MVFSAGLWRCPYAGTRSNNAIGQSSRTHTPTRTVHESSRLRKMDQTRSEARNKWNQTRPYTESAPVHRGKTNNLDVIGPRLHLSVAIVLFRIAWHFLNTSRWHPRWCLDNDALDGWALTLTLYETKHAVLHGLARRT